MNLEELKTLDKCATPAPWSLYVPEWSDLTFGVDDAHGKPIIKSEVRTSLSGLQSDADARLIVALRNALAGLLELADKPTFGEWKPWDTAPKRGQFLAYYAPGDAIFCVESVETVEGEKGWMVVDTGEERVAFKSGLTLWTELPAKPTETKKGLSIWTIYNKPKDFPNTVVARLWNVSSAGKFATNEIRVAPTLEEVRSLLPPGLYKVPREKGDDPCIIESWI